VEHVKPVIIFYFPRGAIYTVEFLDHTVSLTSDLFPRKAGVEDTQFNQSALTRNFECMSAMRLQTNADPGSYLTNLDSVHERFMKSQTVRCTIVRSTGDPFCWSG
jgi:hypothetical protein